MLHHSRLRFYLDDELGCQSPHQLPPMTRSRLVLVPQALAQHLSQIGSVLSPLHISRLDALQDAQAVQNVAAMSDNAMATILGRWGGGQRRRLVVGDGG
jgi:hypothetical protein